MAIADSISRVEQFKGRSLTRKIAEIEFQLPGGGLAQVTDANGVFGISQELLVAAAAVKKASAQIDVVIHAVGILYALPYILRDSEVVEGLSLGAGSARSDFDLVTDQRIAEFKFIRWQEKGNAVRNKSLFQDFFRLAREDTEKERCLYLLQSAIPLHFLRGGRDILRVLDRNRRLTDDFRTRYDGIYRTVGEYYRAHKDTVRIVDLTESVPGFDAFMSVFE